MQRRMLTLISMVTVLLILAPLGAISASAATTPSPTLPATPEASSSAPATATPPADGPYVTVRLVDARDQEPVVGVTLAVTDADGVDVGSAATDSDGRVIVPIDELGAYTVTLDSSTLPEGIELSGSATTQIVIQARLDGPNGGLFPIGVQAAVTVPFSERLITSLVSGVKFGLLVALAALGLSLIFGTTGLTNFAHGELITFGALATYVANRGLGVPVVLSGVIAVFVSALFGWAQDRGLWRPLRRRGTGLIAMMIVSIGFGLLLRNLFQYLIGSSRLSLSQYVSQRRSSYWIFDLADKEIAIIGISLLAIIVVSGGLVRTRLGKSMRAVSDNPALAASSGMQVDRVISSVWILGTALTGLSGVLLAVNSQINFLMGFRLLLLVFAGVTLGGLGTIWGALFGSMVIGIMVEVGPLFGVPSSIKEIGALVVLILVLLIRPQGILGRRERVG